MTLETHEDFALRMCIGRRIIRSRFAVQGRLSPGTFFCSVSSVGAALKLQKGSLRPHEQRINVYDSLVHEMGQFVRPQ
jgi:hypothetical protein